MKRRLFNMPETRIAVGHLNRRLALPPSRLRKLGAVALITLFALVPLLSGRTSARSSAVSRLVTAKSAPSQADCSEKIVFSSDRDGNDEIYVMDADGSGQTRLTNSPATDFDPVFSPDRSKIAFASDRDGNQEIYAMNADGSNPTRLTTNGANDLQPAFSPDGGKIIFTSGRDGNQEIYAINADGSNPTRLSNNPADDFDPAISPDGGKIAFVSNRDYNFEIYVMNADGSGQTRLTTGPNDLQPAFSPDGGKITFVSNFDIYVMNADGSNPTNLTNTPAAVLQPAFSPDGSKIAFVSNQEIYVMNADGSNPTNLTNNPAGEFAPSWGGAADSDGDGVPDCRDICPLAPNPEKIVFASTRDGIDKIYVMDADGSHQTRLTNNSANDYDPVFSPDRSKIAFVSTRDGNDEIYVMDADGSHQTRLTNNPAFDLKPTFSPDGSKIGFYSNRDGNGEIYIMDADGSNPTNLSNNPAADDAPAFSPDGSKIAFVSYRDGNGEIYVMNADGSNPTNLSHNSAFDDDPVFSPDGSKIVFNSERNDSNEEIYVMDADGSNPTRLTTNPALDLQPAFSPDGSKIAFVSYRDGNFEIYVMNADGSHQTNLSNNQAADDRPSWGRQVNVCNTAPTIAAQSVSQIADSSSNGAIIATVSDPDQTEETLAVSISSNGNTFSSSASLNGVSVSNVAVDSTGQVTATVGASCTASAAAFTLRVTDAASATVTGTVTVGVTPENQPPQITCGNVATQTANTNASCQATVPDVTALVRAQSTDNCTAKADLIITQNPAANSTVSGAGSHPITVTVKDAANNSQTCTVGFMLNDTTAPTISCANITKSTDPNQCAAVVSFAPTASDNCSGVGKPTCTPPSGTSFPKGATSVSCTVKDAANNESLPCSFTVTVNDTQPPSITPLANISVPAAARLCSAVVSYNPPPVSDNCPGVGVPACTPPSGASFDKGTTAINCTVKDAANNQANASFTVTVVDTQPPTIACPPNVIAATINPGDPSVAVSFETPSTIDNCGSVSVVCAPPSGSQFPRGATTVNCTATDTSNNQASCAFTVRVFDYVIADDVNGKILRFDSVTGDYDFLDCRKSKSLSGRGTVTIVACKTTLNDAKPDRNVVATANPCTKKGNATLTYEGVTHTLNDLNLSGNPVRCP